MVKVFVVHDSKAESYGTPFYQRATGEAIRGFSDEVNRQDGKSALANHPADFTLFEIGIYDEIRCEFDLYPSRKSLGNGVDHRRDEDRAQPMQLAK